MTGPTVLQPGVVGAPGVLGQFAGKGILSAHLGFQNLGPEEWIELPDSIDLEIALVPAPATIWLVLAGAPLTYLLRGRRGSAGPAAGAKGTAGTARLLG